MARVTKWDDLLGMEFIIRRLKVYLEEDRVPSFMIFTGAPGVGKTATAKLLAVEDTSKSLDADYKEHQIKEVILNNNSTNDVILYNMSKIKGDDDTIAIKNQMLNAGIALSGKRYIIMDEGHGMSKKAQNSILPDLEFIPPNVHVIICTTELGMLQSAVQSRAKHVINFNSLSNNNMMKLLNDIIDERKLVSSIDMTFLLSSIALYAGNQPRLAFNILEGFSIGERITKGAIDVIMDTGAIHNAVSLLEHVYSLNIIAGLSFVQSINVTEFLKQCLIQVSIVALGGSSNLVDSVRSAQIREITIGDNGERYLRFLSEFLANEYNSKSMLAGVYLKHCVLSDEISTGNVDPVLSNTLDARLINSNGSTKNLLDDSAHIKQNITEATIESLYSDAPVVENGG